MMSTFLQTYKYVERLRVISTSYLVADYYVRVLIDCTECKLRIINRKPFSAILEIIIFYSLFMLSFMQCLWVLSNIAFMKIRSKYLSYQGNYHWNPICRYWYNLLASKFLYFIFRHAIAEYSRRLFLLRIHFKCLSCNEMMKWF